jgi:parvulin-like peptidyl-prolyl isomerase
MSRSHLLILTLCLALGAVLTGALTACGHDAAGAPAKSSSASPSADPVVLLVDGRPVHRSAVEAVRAEFRLGGGSGADARAREEVVRRELLRREAEQLGVKADPTQVEAQRDAMVQQAGGEDALAKLLAAAPMTEQQLRSGLADGVLHEAVENAKFGDRTATSQEARAYYDKHRSAFHQDGSVHLYAIQVAAERIAESALGRLRQGRPFAEVARQFTTDSQSKASGGDQGVVALSSLPPAFTKAITAAPSGKVVGPLQGPGGWFLLKAEDLKQARTPSFGEVRAEVVKELTRRDRYQALEKWLDAARKKASVTQP